ncbi:hypothetical protein EK21DRAFT_76293 [Setomelanomma holmii]|uniref:Uncharacterized protein n=1 Tax=Setomelanomma holmii TaxID=210430 RepID=A0A9P4H0R8_9PLEO|nr:hypothetical protein EK21DRAFT_76293 [Setomelanomma holmii]
MLPAAGLFLPEGLHRQERPAPGDSETDGARLKYFQRRAGRTNERARQTQVETVSKEDIATVDSSDEPASITTALKFANFVSSSNKASAESQALAFLIHRVHHDLTEGSRLYLSPAVTNFLEAWPDRKSWIDTILIDVRRALNDIGSYMDTFRVAGDDGGPVGLKRKFEWISSHQKRLQSKQQLLASCHQSLVTAINIMQTVELCGVTNGTWQDPIYEAPVQPWVKNDNTQVLRGPYSRRERSFIRQTYFNRTNEQSSTQFSHDGTSNTNPLFRDLHYPSDHEITTTCSSLDHFPSPRHSLSGQSRASLDSVPPLSHSERLQNAGSSGLGPRTSIDVIKPMPTLDEKTIERNDSTSTTGMITVSQVAKRYSPTPVFIKRHVGRHRSLPSELPHVQSQSSLTEDLADWADWLVIPGSQSDKIESIEWDAESNSQSPSISVLSCPAVAQVTAPNSTVDPLSSASRIDASFFTSSPRLHNETPSQPPDSSASPLSESSSRTSTIDVEPSSDDIDLSTHQQALLQQSYVQFSPSSQSTSSQIPQPARPPPPVPHPEAFLPPTTKISSSQPHQSTDEEPSSSHRNTELLQAPQQRSDVDRASLTAVIGPAIGSKPMSAQAKRRAAHQKRMEIAFGRAGEQS